MTEGISSADNRQSVFKDFPRKSNDNNSIPIQKIRKQEGDKVIISNPGTEQTPAMNKLQAVSLVIGTLTSIGLFAIFAKTLIPSGKYKNILKYIKEFKGPDFVKSKLLFEYEKLKSSFMDMDGFQNYFRNVQKLNFGKSTKKVIDIDRAKNILDEDLIGLNNVKEEVLTHLEVQNHYIENKITDDSPLILCLDGPPGVGKTSIAEIIAKAMDRPFQRISLAGASHETFIKGAERVFKGAEPGQIIKALQNAGAPNPVILLDEIDKMGCSMELGDPAAALLDALEPKQCKNFTDAYLEIPYDLSNVTFIITSNDIECVPKVLKDRLKIMHIEEYSPTIKKNICEMNIKKMMKKLKLEESQVEFTANGIEEIVKRAQDQGARKTIENLQSIFDRIIINLRRNGYDQKIIVDDKFAADVLKNQKQKTMGFINE